MLSQLLPLQPDRTNAIWSNRIASLPPLPPCKNQKSQHAQSRSFSKKIRDQNRPTKPQRSQKQRSADHAAALPSGPGSEKLLIPNRSRISSSCFTCSRSSSHVQIKFVCCIYPFFRYVLIFSQARLKYSSWLISPKCSHNISVSSSHKIIKSG